MVLKRRLQPQCWGSGDLVPPRPGERCPDLAGDAHEGPSRLEGSSSVCAGLPPSALVQDLQGHNSWPRSRPAGTVPSLMGDPERMGECALRTETPGGSESHS